MFDDGFLFFLSFLIGILFVVYFESNTELKKELEIIKNTKDYQVYDKCYEFDEKYYCYNVVEE